MSTNKRGWYGESRRHSLARRGVKTSTVGKPVINRPVPITQDQFEERARRLKDGTYKVTIGSKTHTDKDVGKLADDLRAKGLLKEMDSDGDGMPDNVDCDPDDPEKQGFFDALAVGVASNLITRTPDAVKEKRIRDKLEAREEELERKKEQKLLKLNSRIEEKRALAEFKAKEKELDRLQEELDEGSLKQKLKAGAISVGKKTFILAKKGFKRTREELSDKQPKKFTNVTLTDQERSATSTSTQKRLMSQEKKNAELEAQIRLKNLKKEEKQLKQQLSTLQTKRKKRKKEKGLFD